MQQLNNTPIYGLYNTNCISLHNKKNFKLEDKQLLCVIYAGVSQFVLNLYSMVTTWCLHLFHCGIVKDMKFLVIVIVKTQHVFYTIALLLDVDKLQYYLLLCHSLVHAAWHWKVCMYILCLYVSLCQLRCVYMVMHVCKCVCVCVHICIIYVCKYNTCAQLCVCACVSMSAHICMCVLYVVVYSVFCSSS